MRPTTLATKPARALRPPLPRAHVADVVIVGAGLAGSALATRLARRGLRVLVLERARQRGEKLCGEFLSPDALASLAALGQADALLARGAVPVHGWRFTAPSGVALERPLPKPGLALSRRALDSLLAQGAVTLGATLLEGARATAVQRIGLERFQVEWLTSSGGGRALARIVVDATGRSGSLLERPAETPREARRREQLERAARRLEAEASTVPAGAVVRGDSRIVAFKRHFGGGLGLLDGRVEVHAFPGGYCGLVEVEGGRINACFIAPATSFREAGGRAAPLLERAAAASPALAARLRGLVPLGDGFLSTTKVAHGRPKDRPPSGVALTIGDAASSVAPLCGDGMAMALRSAELAETALLALLEGSTPWSVGEAELSAALRREFARRRWLGTVLQEALVRPWLASLLLRAGRLVPPAADWLTRATRGA